LRPKEERKAAVLSLMDQHLKEVHMQSCPKWEYKLTNSIPGWV